MRTSNNLPIFMKYCVICVSWEQYHTHQNPDEFNSYTYCPCSPIQNEKVQFHYLLTSLSLENILIYLSLIRKIKNPYNKLQGKLTNSLCSTLMIQKLLFSLSPSIYPTIIECLFNEMNLYVL